ncbi:DUF4468 domain-containing protein [Albibacterium indicum]|uniref:DUF4468 domain-containing protein n=1 Tax=Albibacterium indicum TaxID=2292082 RepID=UPI000E4DA1CB|nr:DUF4468 domain-containing protein [Pedobacter indicus]
MKASIFTLFLCVCIGSLQAQEIPFNKESGKIEYAGTVTKQGTQDALYSEIKAWITQTFKSAEEVMLTDDPQAGKLSLQGLSYISLDPASDQDTALIDVPVHFNLLFDVQDNGYRYLISDIYFEYQELIIPMEETLLTPTQQERIIRDRLIESPLSEEETAALVREELDRYRQYKNKSRSTFNGIEWLIKEGLAE